MVDEQEITFVKGRKIDQRKLRKFLRELNFEDVEQFRTDEGYYRSPITGELFRTKWQLWGSFGGYLKPGARKDPREPSRAGYTRAIRAGLEPTSEQKEAHRIYNKAHRKKRRDSILRAKGIDPAEMDPIQEEIEAPVEKRRVPLMSMD